ncbi:MULTISPECIES: hypothetical protein [Methylobacterium]|nr:MULTISPECIES: hypothetical protein [Methylobacterium]
MRPHLQARNASGKRWFTAMRAGRASGARAEAGVLHVKPIDRAAA